MEVATTVKHKYTRKIYVNEGVRLSNGSFIMYGQWNHEPNENCTIEATLTLEYDTLPPIVPGTVLVAPSLGMLDVIFVLTAPGGEYVNYDDEFYGYGVRYHQEDGARRFLPTRDFSHTKFFTTTLANKKVRVVDWTPTPEQFYVWPKPGYSYSPADGDIVYDVVGTTYAEDTVIVSYESLKSGQTLAYLDWNPGEWRLLGRTPDSRRIV